MLNRINPFLKLLYLAQSFNLFADYLLIPLFALLVLDAGGGAHIAGLLWATSFGVSAIIGFFLIKFEDRTLNPRYLLSLNYAIKTLAWTLLALNQSLLILFVAQIMLGFAGAIGGPSFNTLVSDHLDKDRHVADWSLLQVISNLVVATASAIGGFMLERSGFVLIFTSMAILEFMALLILIKTRHKNNSAIFEIT